MPNVRKLYLSLDELSSLSTISVEQAAFLIGISRQAAYEAVNRGEIQVVRFGRRVRVLAKPLHAMLVGSSSIRG